MPKTDLETGATAAEMRLLQRLRHAIPEASAEELAILLGLEVGQPVVRPVTIEPSSISMSAGSSIDSIQVTQSQTNYPPRQKILPFLCHTRTQWKEMRSPEYDPPGWYDETTAFKDKIVGPKIKSVPDPAPLSSWTALWPVLHGLFRASKKTNRLHLPKLIDHAVKQTPIKALPWQTKLRWPNEIVLIIDTSRHLAPYIRDYEWLLIHLVAWFREKLSIVICTDSERQLYEYKGRSYEEFPPEINNTQALYLGDLGFLDQQKISPAQWLKVGRALVKQNVRVHSLLTVSSADFQYGFDQYFDLYTWDQFGVSPAAKVASKQRGISQKSEAQLEQLLACLSPAIEITPAIVREMRKARGMGVSVESLIVQHHALQGFAVHFQWRDKAINQSYRNKLVEDGDSDSESSVWETIQRYEHYLPVELQVEQRQKLGKPLMAAQKDYIRQLIKSGHMGSLDESNEDMLIDWIKRLARRACDEAWSEDTESVYALYWNRHKDDVDCEIPARVDTTRLPEWIARKNASPIPVTLQQQGNQLIISQRESSRKGAAFKLAEFDWEEGAELSLRSGSGNKKRPLRIDTEVLLDDSLRRIEINMPSQSLTFESFTCPSWATGIGRDRYGLFVEVRINGISFIMRWIPPGEFMMGSPEHEAGRLDREGPQHRVRIEQGYWLAETACTQSLWQTMMKENPSIFKSDPENPVENIGWDMAQAFITKLNETDPEFQFRLPSEAEWEYACRAGTETPFWFGSDLTTDDANYNGNHPYADGKKGEYREKSMPVKSFRANPWGLYQMHGNVWEWCEDDWHASYEGEGRPDDGSAWKRGSIEEHVCRGGSWFYYGGFLRSACRDGFVFFADDGLGFRLARGSEFHQTGPVLKIISFS